MAYVMIIDDDEDFAAAASTILRNAGHEVQIELDTESATKSMEKRPPELVILDVMFPEDASAGFELARTMRHYNEKLKDIPVLMLTAVNAKFPLGFGSRDIDDNWLPVSDFLEKPMDFDVLRGKVDALLLKTKNSQAD
jgi:DNA-binding response OmpR family regulator